MESTPTRSSISGCIVLAGVVDVFGGIRQSRRHQEKVFTREKNVEVLLIFRLYYERSWRDYHFQATVLHRVRDHRVCSSMKRRDHV